MRRVFGASVSLLALGVLAACASAPAGPSTDVASTPTSARAADGRWISWIEHRIDDEGLSGLPLRGADGLKLADIDRDGLEDVVSAHEDSRHVRIAFRLPDLRRWTSVTIAEGDEADTAEDVAIADLNGDGWPDVLIAAEKGHLLYLQNPGAGARTRRWARLVVPQTQGRGSWIRVFAADFDGDGRPEVAAANKGVVNTGRSAARQAVSVFSLDGVPLAGASWREQVVARVPIPVNAMPFDIDRDGDQDIIVGSLLEGVSIAENRSRQDPGALPFRHRKIALAPGGRVEPDWKSFASGFHVAPGDVDGDGRADLTLAFDGQWRGGGAVQTFGWARQPESLAQPWALHSIGALRPDAALSMAFADIDGDGDRDMITGAYSGLNIFRGNLTPAPRDRDGPEVTADHSVGRIAWFERPADPRAAWTRHDVMRRVRGMHDEFIPRDLDGDGDVDFVGTRGNSGSYDGVFWLEQVRSRRPRAAMRPARPVESRGLPLAPADWADRYGR